MRIYTLVNEYANILDDDIDLIIPHLVHSNIHTAIISWESSGESKINDRTLKSASAAVWQRRTQKLRQLSNYL